MRSFSIPKTPKNQEKNLTLLKKELTLVVYSGHYYNKSIIKPERRMRNV